MCLVVGFRAGLRVPAAGHEYSTYTGYIYIAGAETYSRK